MTIREWQKKIHEWARSKGWWGDAVWDRGIVAEKLLLIHSEITEAVEEYRNGRGLNEVYFPTAPGGEHPRPPDCKPEGFPTELADAVIRIFDLAEACGIDLDMEIECKMNYNETRPHKHGGKAF